MTEQQTWWFEMGLQRGYPVCCIEAFLVGDQKRGGFFEGTGFVPCSCCYDRNPEDLINHIDTFRQIPYTFPFDDENSFERYNSSDLGRKVIDKINNIRTLMLKEK